MGRTRDDLTLSYRPLDSEFGNIRLSQKFQKRKIEISISVGMGEKGVVEFLFYSVAKRNLSIFRKERYIP